VNDGILGVNLSVVFSRLGAKRVVCNMIAIIVMVLMGC